MYVVDVIAISGEYMADLPFPDRYVYCLCACVRACVHVCLCVYVCLCICVSALYSDHYRQASVPDLMPQTLLTHDVSNS